MATSSLIIKSKDSAGKTLQKTVTYVNPEVRAEKMVAFATQLNELTTNEYVKSNLIDNTDIDVEERPWAQEKLTPTLTISKSGEMYSYAYDGDGEIYGWSDTVASITIFRDENMVDCKGDHFILYASEGARYKAAKAVYPVEEG